MQREAEKQLGTETNRTESDKMRCGVDVLSKCVLCCGVSLSALEFVYWRCPYKSAVMMPVTWPAESDKLFGRHMW